MALGLESASMLDRLGHRTTSRRAPPGRHADPARELVADRAGDERMGLERHAVADEGHGLTGVDRAGQPDGERVHRDRPHDGDAAARHHQFRPGEVPPEAVGVSDGDDPDPGLLRRDEPPAVPGRVTRRQPSHLRQLRLPPQRRARARTASASTPVGVDPVERDPAARRVQLRLGRVQRRCAVGRVADVARGVGLGRAEEPLELLHRERPVAVGGREVRHQADHRASRLGQLAEPPSAHAGVELQVDGDALGQSLVATRPARGPPRVRSRRRPSSVGPSTRILVPGCASRSGRASPTVATQSALGAALEGARRRRRARRARSRPP